MSTPVSLYDYQLPAERIAQVPAEPRDSSRLLVMDRFTGKTAHKAFRDIIGELKAGDLLVMNDSRVFKARLRGKRFDKEFEVFLLRPLPDALEGASLWHALVRPGKRVHVGNAIEIGGLKPTVVEKHEDGSVTLAFNISDDEVFAFCDEFGEVPVPPYVEKAPDDASKYQTVYAKEKGSVAAPTAGFHFTPELIEKLKGKGVEFAFVTLHVGLGTFRPVKTETLEEHVMHGEWVSISPETSRAIDKAKAEGRRVIAVGTTTVRALEGSGVPGGGFSGDINLFITPGFDFKVIDALITNFHLPKSTLLVLVSAFAGREHVLAAYQEAIEKGYRFYSFGDAMFIR
ncbi:tRNA preQ1(34) S-adenosylmethionine ribosyltransferase-isomerase QueA [Patescibacteria group bacterium]|nr:MAG: tRNA preQ1(34) S-adenosylmethionine ribosyltransferase-isomerase QueA [Patescibacteria group bacterium]